MFHLVDDRRPTLPPAGVGRNKLQIHRVEPMPGAGGADVASPEETVDDAKHHPDDPDSQGRARVFTARPRPTRYQPERKQDADNAPETAERPEKR